MSRNNENSGRLSDRDKELVALGSAIASNCIPCVEYHIPQARKTGLSDFEIGQAVALADKVRRVPADKVLQTAAALLERENGTRIENEGEACVCSDEAKNSGDGKATGPVEPHAHDVRLDNESVRR
jgi:4-carboxymuconolactone decarboxylase